MLVDRSGVPLAVLISPANWHDSRLLEPLLDAVRPIKGLWGRPRKRPEKLHGDKGYDFDRHRWVVERTLAWLHSHRRLAIRYERLEAIHQAFLDLGCALICLNFLQQAGGL